MDKQSLGKFGEEVAVKFLENKGHKIVSRNKTFYLKKKKFLEIDIITEMNQKIYLFEVKTRKSSRFGTPQESVSKSKLSKIYSFIEIFFKNQICEFQIISIKVEYLKEPKISLIILD